MGGLGRGRELTQGHVAAAVCAPAPRRAAARGFGSTLDGNADGGEACLGPQRVGCGTERGPEARWRAHAAGTECAWPARGRPHGARHPPTRHLPQHHPRPPPFLSQDEIKAKAGAAHDHTNATKATLVAKVQAVKDRLEDALEAATARPRKEYHVAFSGSGSLAVFQLGVSAALEEYRVYTEV